jgi:AraC-like DNA-binding protein
MDVFSEILRGVALKGAFFFSAEFSSPWGFCSPPSRELALLLAPGAAHLVIYHFLIEGAGVLRVDDGSTLKLRGGDVVVVPHGNSHVMCSAEDTRAAETTAMIAKLERHDLTTMQAGGGGEVARFVCGFMACDPILGQPILNGLPSAFKVNLRTERAAHWLENSILHLVEECGSGYAGSDVLLAKLSEALFIDTLRRYVDNLPSEDVGWLAGARDPIVGKSLALLHAKAQHPWTIAVLAKEVGISRSALVERFTRYVSQPPIAYLIRWRLQLAARALAATSRGVAEIAADVGYESEAAFNRAFKRAFGLPPARYRREHRTISNNLNATFELP